MIHKKFEFDLITGGKVSLRNNTPSIYLIVNTASLCGFTPQYEGLQKLYEEYKDKGLIVIATPCNDFGKQEPGSKQDICDLTLKKFNTTFPITNKLSIKGRNPDPFYQYIRSSLPWLAYPKWNFYKYLLNSNGEFIDWYSSITKPTSNRLINKINKNLK